MRGQQRQHQEAANIQTLWCCHRLWVRPGFPRSGLCPLGLASAAGSLLSWCFTSCATSSEMEESAPNPESSRQRLVPRSLAGGGSSCRACPPPPTRRPDAPGGDWSPGTWLWAGSQQRRERLQVPCSPQFNHLFVFPFAVEIFSLKPFKLCDLAFPPPALL